MDADEREVYNYLKSFLKEFISAREVSRRAGGKKRFRHDQVWAQPVLTRMLERGILETDPSGHYRIKTYEMNANQPKKWISPQIQRILQQSGKDFNPVTMDQEGMDEHYDKL